MLVNIIRNVDQVHHLHLIQVLLYLPPLQATVPKAQRTLLEPTTIRRLPFLQTFILVEAVHHHYRQVPTVLLQIQLKLSYQGDGY